MKNTIFVALLVILFFVTLVGQPSAQPARSESATHRTIDFTPDAYSALKDLGFVLPTGKITAPDFTLKDLKGTSRSLSSFRGKVVFLNFWGVWCYYCREEMPSLQKFYDRLKSKGLEIVAVNVQDSEETARDFIVKNKHTFPVLLDKEYKAVSLYGPRGFPTSYLIDKEGNLQAMLVGSRAWDTPEVYRTFEKILASP